MTNSTRFNTKRTLVKSRYNDSTVISLVRYNPINPSDTNMRDKMVIIVAISFIFFVEVFVFIVCGFYSFDTGFLNRSQKIDFLLNNFYLIVYNVFDWEDYFPLFCIENHTDIIYRINNSNSISYLYFSSYFNIFS